MVYAFVKYESALIKDLIFQPSTVVAQTNAERCTAANRCKVLNCPFGIYKTSAFTDCLHLTDIDALEVSPITPQKGDHFPLSSYFA